jgi:hypothetical protein
MPRLGPQTLPVEIRSRILDFLDQTHPASVLAFALASQECYAVAARNLYRSIHINVSTARQLGQTVERYEVRLWRLGAT